MISWKLKVAAEDKNRVTAETDFNKEKYTFLNKFRRFWQISVVKSVCKAKYFLKVYKLKSKNHSFDVLNQLKVLIHKQLK